MPLRVESTGLNELSEYRDLLDQYGVRLNVIGRKDMLPPDLQQVIQQAEDMTRHHDR
jgi:ditrans,polycis-polyprenyl diphosphate synthase